MSAIFGIFNLDGRPVDPKDLSRMKQAMSYLGPDGSQIWAEGSVGLGHLMRYNTPESHHETLPLQSTEGRSVLTAVVRLDNREDLFSALKIPPAEQERMPDGALTFKAYDRWGTTCPDVLLGDWAFACWDVNKRRLFIARDHIGTGGLYYYQSRRMFAFASSLKGLLALPNVPCCIDPEAITWRFPGYRRGASTIYKDILQLTPGHAITITAKKADLQCYWHPQDTPEVRFSSDDDYVDAFLEVYAEAVRCRLRSNCPVGVMLSGGLDSGSVAALASRELEQSGQRLFAFSSVPNYDVTETTPVGRCGDETPFIEAICDYAKNIDVTYIRAKRVTPMAGIKRGLEILEQPDLNAGNAYWLTALFEAAQQRNISTLLSGEWGNFTISWEGDRDTHLLSLLKKRRWRSLLRELNAWRDIHSLSFWGTFKSQFLRPLVLSPRLMRYRLLRSSRGGRSLLNPVFVRSMIRTKRQFEANLDPIYKSEPPPHRMVYNIFRKGTNRILFEAGAAFGLDVRDPTFDKRVVSFCLGIPQDQYTHNGLERLLVRRAMVGLMPEHVLWNERRGVQAADILHRLRASYAEIESALQKLENSAQVQQYLNVSLMREVFHSLQHKQDATLVAEANQILLQGLTIGLFLLRFEDN